MPTSKVAAMRDRRASVYRMAEGGRHPPGRRAVLSQDLPDDLGALAGGPPSGIRGPDRSVQSAGQSAWRVITHLMDDMRRESRG
jgi:hypothetical protein